MAIGDEYDRGIGQAVHLMQFYMSTLAGYAGMRWDSDNNAEVQDLVECIINAAKQEMAQAMANAATPAIVAPDWTMAPDWAQWWAVDANGFSFWYPYAPSCGAERWCGDGYLFDDFVDLGGGHWYRTLTKRPAVQP